MINTITFYPVDRIDVGIGASKNVQVIATHKWVGSASDAIILPGHPAPQQLNFQLLEEDLLRITNNSMNIASLWPGHEFLVVTLGHPVYMAMAEKQSMKSAVVTGHIKELQTKTDINVLGISKHIMTSLANQKITTVEELEAMDDDDLLNVSGIGPGRQSVIRAAIARYRKTKVAKL